MLKIKHCLDTGAGQVLQNIYTVVIASVQRRRTIFPGGHPNSLLVQTLNFGEHMGISLIFVWIGHTLMYMYVVLILLNLYLLDYKTV